MRPAPRVSSKHVCAIVAVMVSVAPTGQLRSLWAQGYDTWSKVESAEETKVYSEQLGEGTFGDAQKAVLERIILPQLGKPSNRSMLPQVRQRMREILTRGTANPKMFDAANSVVADYMTNKVVGDDSQDVVVRVNAMILVGELVAADRKPWPGSVEPLAKAAADGDLPLAVRIAAVSGLVRQISSGRGSDPAFAAAVAPVVASIITAPPEGDALAVAWMIGRCLDMLPVVGGTPEALAAAAAVLSNEKADVDLRVRAATAVGRLVKPDAAPDLSKALDRIRSMATDALSRDIADAESRRFARKLGGAVDKGTLGAATDGLSMSPPAAADAGAGAGGLFGGGIFGGETAAGGIDNQSGVPTIVDPDAVPALACRRNAWRLLSLADALKPEGSSVGGIASVLSGDAAVEAIQLATVLREQGRAIEAAPEEQSVKTALAAIEALAKPAPADAPGSSPAAPGGPPASTTPQGDSPFGGAGEGSPF